MSQFQPIGVPEQQAAQRVDHRAEGLVLGEVAQSGRHGRGGDDARSDQRQQDQRERPVAGRGDGLGGEAEGQAQPGQGEGDEREQPGRAQPLREAGGRAEADGEGDAEHDHHGDQGLQCARHDAGDEDGRAKIAIVRNRSMMPTVTSTLVCVEMPISPAAAVMTISPGRTKFRNRPLARLPHRALERPAEDVHEQEQEQHGNADDGGDGNLVAHLLLDVAPQHRRRVAQRVDPERRGVRHDSALLDWPVRARKHRRGRASAA